MKTFSVVLLYIVLSTLCFSQEKTEKTFMLRNGDKISGAVISETDSLIVLQTSFGVVDIAKINIKPKEATLHLKDGNRLSGEVVKQNSETIVIQSNIGILTIRLEDIDRISEIGEIIPGTTAKEEFFYSKERLIDVFFDPTGYTMEKGTIYLSGLSWGVGISDNFEISSSYWRYFIADLNLRPKYQFYKGGNVEVEDAAAIGFHLHSAGQTGKQKFAKEPFADGHHYQENWNEVGNYNDYFIWTELFASYTRSYLKSDKKGRIAYHIGASVILHRAETMPRAWIAVENDITDRFKILGQAYYDPFQPSYRERINNSKTKNPFDIDFGFVYAFSENFRVGIHYQPYVILFYYKF